MIESLIDGARQADDLLSISGDLSDDDRRRESGERPIYAVDSNIAIFLSQPSNYAASGRDNGVLRRGFGEVFDGDSPDRSDVVAHALAEHLYRHLRPATPLLLIPPIAGEVHSYVRDLARSHAAPSKEDEEAWRKRGDEFLSKLEKEGRFSERTESLIRQIQDVLFLRYGPPAALRRLRRMFADRQLLSSDVASEFLAPDIDPNVRVAIDPARAARSVLSLGLAANEWLRRGLDRGRGDSDFRDAYVMARIEDMNRRLEAERSTYRVIYVTADRNLLEVVRAAGNPHLRLRHPRAWLPRLGIFQGGAGELSTSLVDLLKLAARAPHDATTAREAAGQRWTDYLQASTSAFVPSSETRDLFFDQAQDMLARYSANIDRFHEEIEQLQETAWEDCFAVSAMTAATEAQQTTRYYARNVPPLVFEAWDTTQQTVEMFLEWHTPHDYDPAKFRSGIARIDKEDPTGYARYIALGAIFACRGDWDAAASLAKRANERARTDGAGYGEANGREGAFFAAVCLRHIARDEDELEASEALLAEAEAIAGRERKVGEGDRTAPVWDVVPERFAAERIASDTTRFYFRRYRPDLGIRIDDGPGARTLIDRLSSLLGDVMTQFRAPSIENRKTQKRALEQLAARLIVNILGLAIVARLEGPQIVRAWQDAQTLGLARAPDAPQVSYITAVTLLAYKRARVPEPGSIARDADRLKKLLAGRDQHRVFPYDGARFAEIERTVFPQ